MNRDSALAGQVIHDHKMNINVLKYSRLEQDDVN